MATSGAKCGALVTVGEHHLTLMCYQQLTKVTMVLSRAPAGESGAENADNPCARIRARVQVETRESPLYSLRPGAQFA